MTSNFDQLVSKANSILSTKYVSDDKELHLRRTHYWELVNEIKAYRSEAIKLGHDMLSRSKSYERFFGISLLGQICNPMQSGEENDADMIVRWLSDMVDDEKSVICLSGIATALGHAYRPSAEPALLKLSESQNNDIRWAATVELSSVFSDEASPTMVARLLTLSTDKDPDIRDWATFHLGSIELDTEEIRQALVARTKDRHFDTKSEAIQALAEKNDKRGIAPLLKRLSSKHMGRLDFISAGLYGISELLPLLEAQKDEPFTDERYLIEWAIKRCDTDANIRDSVDDEWQGDKWYLDVQNGLRKPMKYRDV